MGVGSGSVVCFREVFRLKPGLRANQPDDVVELDDLKADPTRERNLVADSAEKVKELSAMLDAWWKP